MDQSNESALKIQFQVVNDEENQNIVFKVIISICIGSDLIFLLFH